MLDLTPICLNYKVALFTIAYIFIVLKPYSDTVSSNPDQLKPKYVLLRCMLLKTEWASQTIPIVHLLI